MGEKDEIEKKAAVADGEKAAVEGGEKVAASGGEKKQDEPTTVVLKLDLHCEGCAKKVRRSISQLKGIEKVKADCNAKKLNVTGNVDPTWLREVVETKTKKKVELIAPLPKKDAGGDKKADHKKTEENKADEDNKKPKEAALSTVVMKTKLHCDGCAQKIKRIISKNIEGVDSVTTDLQKDLITVTGRMEVEKLVTYLREKLKRGLDIIPPKKENATGVKGKEVNGAGDKKEKANGEEKKESGGGEKSKGGEEAKVEVNKMEHHGNYNSQTHYAIPMTMPMPMHNQSYNEHDHGMMTHHQYPGPGYMAHGPPLPPPTYLNTESDHMFSDENPNGCSVM